VDTLAVTVIIPTYNRADLVAKAVESALAAIEPGDEIIVIDDGSTDATPEIMARYGEACRYVRVPNGGAGAARNRGIRLATTPLVAFLDSDDEWMPDKVAVQRQVMQQNPGVLASFTSFCSFKEHGMYCRNALLGWHSDTRDWDEILGPGVPFSSIGSLPASREDFRFHIGDLYAAEFENNYVATSTLMVRREEAGDALWFAENMPTYEDWVCFGRLMRKGPVAYLDCETVLYREHPGPRLGQYTGSDSGLARLQVIDHVWGQDDEFRTAHQEKYNEVRTKLHNWNAYWLLVQGRTRAASQQLRQAGQAPVICLAVSLIPSWLARVLIQRYFWAKSRLQGMRTGVVGSIIAN
jgi:glycosyltransferase involved in cell wall biosynthesis